MAQPNLQPIIVYGELVLFLFQEKYFVLFSIPIANKMYLVQFPIAQ